MINVIIGVLSITAPLCILAFILGWKLRNSTPFRLPPNDTRIENAEADLDLSRIALEKIKIDSEIQIERLRVAEILEKKRNEIEGGESATET